MAKPHLALIMPATVKRTIRWGGHSTRDGAGAGPHWTFQHALRCPLLGV